MVKLTVCMGTGCHLKGSRTVIEKFQELIQKSNLFDKVDMIGKFCIGKCGEKGVSVTVNGTYYGVLPDEAEKFFNEKVLPLA